MARRKDPIPFPPEFKKPEFLADWLELVALTQGDRNASAGDLERRLDLLNCREKESLLGNAFTEIDRREQGAGAAAYPFTRANTSIEFKGNSADFAPYLFCLALSYFGWKARKGAPQNPWLLFEQLASYSAQSYVSGKAIVFGTSSRGDAKKAKNVFRTQVSALAKALGEGGGFRKQRTFSTKDSKVDIVAWRGFSDRRASQVIIFGQCAAGANWEGAKLTELDPEVFWDQWMSVGKVSALLRSVFIPHCVFDDELWEQHARPARLLFDRCRVVAHANEAVKGSTFAGKMLSCCRSEWRLPL
jgi:hypothetical protein